MTHDFYLDEDGRVDTWRLSEDYHNGPECRRCGKIECHHCYDWEDEECPSGQLDIPFEDVVE